jgi:hypothetical protein
MDKICSNDNHIWKRAPKGNWYYCINCEKAIKSSLEIPCKHKWIEQTHSLGINYIQIYCEICKKVKIKIVEKNKID